MSVYLELCEILGISLNEFLAGEDIEVTNVEKKSEDTLIQITKDSSYKQRYLKKIIAVLLIVVGVCVIVFGNMVCNKLRQPQNYIEAVAPDSVVQFAPSSGHWCVCQRPPGGAQRPPSLRYFDRLNNNNVMLRCPLHNSVG